MDIGHCQNYVMKSTKLKGDFVANVSLTVLNFKYFQLIISDYKNAANVHKYYTSSLNTAFLKVSNI